MVVVFMPHPGTEVVGAFAHRNKGDVTQELIEVGRLQSRLFVEPANGVAAEALGDLMIELGRADMALRIAGAAAAGDGATKWRALGMVSDAHAKLLRIPEALAAAKEAMTACDKVGPRACPDHERLRLRLYVAELEVAVKTLKKGINPRHDPDGFRREQGKIHPTFRAGDSPGN